MVSNLSYRRSGGPSTTFTGSGALSRVQRALMGMSSTWNYTYSGIPVDIVCLGDSRTRGVISGGTTYSRWDGWVHILKRLLQLEFNPSTITGGYGYLGFQDNPTSGGLGSSPTANGANVTASASPTYSSDPSTSAGLGLCHMLTTSAVGYILNTNDDAAGFTAEFKLGVTDFEVVGEKQTGYGTLTPVISEDGGAASTTLTAFDLNGAADYGARSGRYQFSSYAGGGGTFSATDYRIRINTHATNTCNFQGLILYNGDYAAGVHVHNLGASGSRLNHYSANALLALDKFGSASAATGSVNAKLVIINVGGYNELQNLQTPAVFFATLQSLVARVLAWTSAPSVLLVIDPRPPMDGSPFTSATHLPLYLGYKDAAYRVQAMYPSVVDIIDFDNYCGQSSTEAVAQGFVNTTDDLHHKQQGMMTQAKVIFNRIKETR